MDRHQDVSPVLAWQMKNSQWYTQENKSDSGDTID